MFSLQHRICRMEHSMFCRLHRLGLLTLVGLGLPPLLLVPGTYEKKIFFGDHVDSGHLNNGLVGYSDHEHFIQLWWLGSFERLLLST